MDQEVASFILALPVKRRLGWRQGKLVLSEAMRDLLPQHISWSRKRPFQLPIDDWLRSEWRPLVQDVLLDGRSGERGWIDAREVRRLLEEHLAGRTSHGRRLYQLLILELWARAILDREAAEPAPASVEDCARELDPTRPLRKVAIIALAGIGDTLRLTPGISQLGRTDPNISVTMYVAQGRQTEQILAGLPPVERQVPQWSLSMRLSGLFWRQPQPYNPSQRDVGRQDSLAFCKLLGVAPPGALRPQMAPPLWEEGGLRRARSKLTRLPRPILAVNAVAGSDIPQRQYPLGKLAQVLCELIQRGVINSVALLGDSYSRSRHGPLGEVLGSRALDFSGTLSLASTAVVMAQCDAVLTIDGGLLHLALATSLPVAALYGPTEIFSGDPRGLPGGVPVSGVPFARGNRLGGRGSSQNHRSQRSRRRTTGLLKVVVLSPAVELGGAERSLLTFLKAAPGKLLKARVILPREGPLGQALTKVGVPWEVVPMPQAVRQFTRHPAGRFPLWSPVGVLQGVMYAARLRSRLTSLAPEVIYTNGIKSHVFGALLRPWVRGRIVRHLRDFWEGGYVGFLADRGPHVIIANSRATAKGLQKYLKQPEKITVVHNAVDPEEFSPVGPRPLPDIWGGFPLRVGMVAGFARWKGHALFVEAAGIVAKKFPRAGFFVVGGEIYDSGVEVGFADYLNRLVSQAGLWGRVIFTGFQTEVAPWYRILDVVVNASLKPEPFGRSLLEAMACGRAVAGPRSGGVPEFIQHGKNGLLYEPGDANELGAAILALLQEPMLRKRLGTGGRDTATAHFTPEAHANAVVRSFFS